MIEQQFVSFLVERIESKVADIRKQTMGETVNVMADEVQIYIDQLKAIIPSVFDVEVAEPRRAPTVRRNKPKNQGGGE